jgi:hypothetical protein
VSTERLRHPVNAFTDLPHQTTITPSISRLATAPPYSDHSTSISRNLMCPDSDTTSAPPSPASIESFDVLDNIPWRRSYISLDAGPSEYGSYAAMRKKQRARMAAVLLLCVLVAIGCGVGGYLAIKHMSDMKLKQTCYARNGGDGCE